MRHSNKQCEDTSDIQLNGLTAVITGAGMREQDGPLNIGAAIAIYFAKAGANVLITDKYTELAANTERTILKGENKEVLPGNIDIAQVDVTNQDSCNSMAKQAIQTFGRIDILVNNVGIAGPSGKTDQLDTSQLETAFRANVHSMIHASRAVLPSMRKNRRGSIINMSSVASSRAGHHGIAYPTTKAAVNGLTASMAGHEGEFGIRVNAILPGLVFTPMVASRGLTSEQRDVRQNASILKQEGSAWDVAAATAFLASNAARWITGLMLPVDGGLSILTENLGVRTN